MFKTPFFQVTLFLVASLASTLHSPSAEAQSELPAPTDRNAVVNDSESTDVKEIEVITPVPSRLTPMKVIPTRAPEPRRSSIHPAPGSISPNVVRYNPRYGYMIGPYVLPNYPKISSFPSANGFRSGYNPMMYRPVGYGYRGYPSPVYQSVYRSRAYPYGTSYLGPAVYPSISYPRTRVYRTPTQSSTLGGAHSSQYFGRPGASHYFSH